jgi:hypothetical protein
VIAPIHPHFKCRSFVARPGAAELQTTYKKKASTAFALATGKTNNRKKEEHSAEGSNAKRAIGDFKHV